MKKYYLFAALATAGLFAGCSADDTLALDNGGAPQVINDNEKAPIQLFIGGAAGTTRGTGTVGSTEGDANNKWGGQQFKLMMLDKGALTYAKDETGTEIYKSAVFTTPNQLAGAEGGNFTAVEVTGTTEDGGVTTAVKYFPQDGSFDFWAYRLDGAETADEPAESDGKLTVDFTIDGSQDIMVSKAVPNVDGSAEDGWKGQSGGEEVTVNDDRVFSAYSVRRGVTPKLNFNHLLTRLVFKVKASEDLSGTEGEENTYAVKVTAIKVKSLATGKLAVAWTPETEVENVIEWTPESETELELQQRAYSYANAVVTTEKVTDWRYPTSGGTQITATTVVYPYDAENMKFEKGLPTGGKTVAEIIAEPGFNSNTAEWYIVTITQKREKIAENVNDNLEALDPVIPMWDDNADGGTQVGEALLVAPQEEYEMTIELSQRVATKKEVRDYIYEATNEENDSKTLYFLNQNDADAYAAATGEAIEAAAAKGHDKKERVEEVTDYEDKTFSKELTLHAKTTTVGDTTTYEAFEANKSYTVKVTLAGQESGGIGGDVEIGPGYGDGGDIDVDMDE